MKPKSRRTAKTKGNADGNGGFRKPQPVDEQPQTRSSLTLRKEVRAWQASCSHHNRYFSPAAGGGPRERQPSLPTSPPSSPCSHHGPSSSKSSMSSSMSTSMSNILSDIESHTHSNMNAYMYQSVWGTGKKKSKKPIYPKYKVLFTEGYGKLGVRVVQNTDLKDGEPQQPISVAAPESSGYKPRKIVKRLSKNNNKKWDKMKKVLKDVFRKAGNPLVKEQLGTLNWILKNQSISSDEETEAQQLIKEFAGDNLHRSFIMYALDIRLGFLHPYDNCIGRQALFALLSMCYELLPDDLYCKLGVRNVGGGAQGYHGSCTIGRFDKDRNCSEKEAVDFLAECNVPKEGSTLVPDGQTYARSRSKNLFSLTAKVKSMPASENQSKRQKSSSAYLQTWLQSLVGLSESDTTYGLLLTPDSGYIMELHLLKATNGITRLVTKDKEWTFLDNTSSETKFNIKNFTEFMEAVIDILLKS